MLKLKQVSSLEKIFLKDSFPTSDYTSASVLTGEEFDYQIAYCSDEITDVSVSVESDLSVDVYAVEHVPSCLPVYGEDDGDYLTRDPGLFPDVLRPIEQAHIRVTSFTNTIWIHVKPMQEGIYPIKVTIEEKRSAVSVGKVGPVNPKSVTFTLKVLKASLPEQKMVYTQWFHGDCIASYYNETPLSESHWEHMEAFIKTAAEHGINMILTPIFTPPLDTEIGGERPTIQLVDVVLERGKYRFGFDKLKRWFALCKKYGIKYFEMAHLFTQWGAKFTPKIMAMVDGVEKRIFGWDVEALSPEYRQFLDAFLPALTAVLREEQIDAYFHISDEPFLEHLEHYRQVVEFVEPYLKDFKVIDALSDYDFYQQGIVKHPIPATDHIEPFLKNEHLWTYYCTSQYDKVCNRFFAMPSYRNRMIGLQFYKFKIEGFLHWGYNFYYSQFSKYPVNPYLITDAGQGFQSGDAFSVYPGEDGKCLPSIRLKVFYHALQDVRAMELLEGLIGREKILKLIDSEGEISFSEYPRSAEFLLSFREKINALIEENWME